MWAEVIRGQKLAVRLLNTALLQDKLAQSYLFYGPAGVGKSLTALRLGLAVQCDQGIGVGCGVCPSCQKLLRGTHPDWHYLEPDGNNIRIDQIRELQSIIARRPHEGRRRIAVLDPAEKMNDPAANALLKLLEEPPEDSLLILISASVQQLLPTIRSRCQPIRFSPLSQDDLALALSDDIPEPQRRLLLRSAQGSMGRLLSLSADKEWDEERKQGIAWYLEEPSWDLLQRLRFAEERETQWRERDAWQQFWLLWQGLTRDRLVLAIGATEERLWNPDAAAMLMHMPPQSPRRLEQRLAQLKEALQQLQTYTSPRLIAESVLLGWMRS